jgi:hypothetical protein
MQLTAEARPPVGVVFDSDFGNSVDTALGLALLYGFDAKKEARVVAVSVSNQNLKAAELVDAIARFYIRPLPIGLYAGGKWAADTPMVTAPLAMQKEDGTPLFPTTIKKLNDTADPAPLIRNALTAQHDQNCAIVLAGPPVDLAAMVALHGAKEIVAAKVRCLVATEAASALPASQRLFSDWPTPIVIVTEDGGGPAYPASSIEKDFSWSPAHPIVAAYRAYRPMPYSATTASMAAVLYAVHPDSPYFKAPVSDGRVRRVVLDQGQKDAILKVYTELASTKPVAPVRRGPPKAEEAKPEKAAEKN